MIESLIGLLGEIRSNCDFHHSQWFHQASELAEKFDISVYNPRVTKRQTMRANHPSNSPEEYYKLSLTIPLLDHVYSDLSSRFSNESLVSYAGLYLIPSKIVSLNSKSPEKSLFKLTFQFFNFYEDDMPSPHMIEKELDLWRHHWINETSVSPNNIINTLKAVDFDVFPNIKEALKILATLPITSSECERSFSGLRRVKTHTRTTMMDERLSDLSILNFHYEKTPDTEAIINKFAGMKNRRLEFNLF